MLNVVAPVVEGGNGVVMRVMEVVAGCSSYSNTNIGSDEMVNMACTA